MKPKVSVYYDTNTHVHISSGNGGTGQGVFTFNTLAGSEPLKLDNGKPLINISGTCEGCDGVCKADCYAIRTQKFRSCERNLRGWGENTLIAKSNLGQLADEVQHFIDNNLVAVFRWHSFGEIPSYDFLVVMNEIAKRNAMVYFYTYTKRFGWIERFITENGDFAPNLTIHVSIWGDNYNNPHGLPEFIFDSNRDMKIPHCPKVDKKGNETGVTCAKCKRCFHAEKQSKIAVYPH